jgi:hypothetical protein
MSAAFDYTLPQEECLRLLFASSRYIGGFIEIRYKPVAGDGFKQEFYPAIEHGVIARRIAELAPVADVYFGVVPRTERAGGARACGESRYLWADLDNPAAVSAALEFEHQPTFLIETSPGHAQAYWELKENLAPQFVRQANLRLATALGADRNSCDVARILRPCGTLNHKYDPPADVRCVMWEVPNPTVTARDLVGHLPDPPGGKVTPIRPSKREDTPDPLLGIPATEYVPALTGRVVGQDRKATCPFHAGGHERTPSLHAYDDPGKGWYCWGCDEGGDLYSFAAKLYDLDPRRDFPAIKQRLVDELRGAAA